MRYLSVASGIEAATVAWHTLGWEAVAYSEIDAFPSAVLAERWPTVPNLGDMTRYKEWKLGPYLSGRSNDKSGRIMANIAEPWSKQWGRSGGDTLHRTDRAEDDSERSSIDLLVGGTPCQSFSVAGLRRGLDDPRGNLMLVYLAIAQTFCPQWIVWENVPGVLSSNGGRDFGALLGGLAELGYGWAYRMLDAQYFGVPQRRRRVFVVGYLGAWQPAAAVLFERESVRGNPPPSREAGARVAASLTRGAESSGKGGYAGRRQEDDYNIVTQALTGRLGSGGPDDNKAQGGFYVPMTANTMKRIAVVSAVRRLTPRECERLMGFPDDYTAITYRGKPAADGPRYKALGNSMARPVMRWIGERIERVVKELRP